MNIKVKQHLFKNGNLCNIINVFTHQFNASLLNKSIDFFNKKIF